MDLFQNHMFLKRCSTLPIIREMQIKTTVRHPLTPVRMAIIKKTTNNEYWRSCGEKGTPLPYWWECKLIQPLQRKVWRFFKKLGIKSPCCCWVASVVSDTATPYTAAHQAHPSLGFSRQEHWSGLTFPSPMHENEKWKWSRSVVSDPQRPHGLQPTRLLHPCDFLGKSTGVV